MVVYLARNCDTPIEVEVEILSGVAGRISCPECQGTGIWAFMEPEIPSSACVDCKGTGKRLVSV